MKKDSQNLICFSHLRWNFVYQRPQHIITMLSALYKTFYIEEPIYDAVEQPYHCFTEISKSLFVIVPHIVPNVPRE